MTIKTSIYRIAALPILIAACQSTPPSPDTPGVKLDPTTAAFYSPQAIAASERWIFVANTGFHFDGKSRAYDPGFVTVIDRASHQIVGRIATSALNPQSIAVAGPADNQQVWLVNAGRVDIDEAGLAVAGTPGSIDRIDLSKSATPTRLAGSIPLPLSATDKRIGNYGTMALVGSQQQALIGSGTRGDIFQVDLSRQSIVHGPQNPWALWEIHSGENGLTVPYVLTDTNGQSTVAVLNYNTDELCLLSGRADQFVVQQCGNIGVQPDFIEGPIDIIASNQPGKLLVLMTIANAVYEIDTTQKPWRIDAEFAKTGLSNNRLIRYGDYLYIINSLSNNIQRVHAMTRQSDLPFAVLPVASNPYDMVITEEKSGPVAWVTLFAHHKIARVDLRTGTLLDSDPSNVVPQITPPVCDTPLATAPIVAISQVVDVTYGPGAGHGQAQLPDVITGAPDGSAAGSGAVDGILSLGIGGKITVGFGSYDVIDGPGPDFIVYENPFVVSQNQSETQSFAEPAYVSVADGDKFIQFTCDIKSGPPYHGCAGVNPVTAPADRRCYTSDSIATSGGDAFDLADIHISRARSIRITDAGISRMGTNNKGFDLDAIVLIHSVKR